jgi:hypothetical protein
MGGVISSFKQEKDIRFPMLFSTTLVSALLAVFSVIVVDKYTKHVELYKLKNKRILGIEKIIYTGVVKNVGNFPIGEVKFEIKLVNNGNASGQVKGGTFFKSSGFFDLFKGLNKTEKPQTIKKEFIVAKDLKPGDAKSFRVYFPFPPYFRNVADFAKVSGH